MAMLQDRLALAWCGDHSMGSGEAFSGIIDVVHRKARKLVDGEAWSRLLPSSRQRQKLPARPLTRLVVGPTIG